MSSVDNRVVQMQFDNAQFEKGVATSVDSINRLNATLSKNTDASVFNGLTEAANRVDLSHISNSVGSIQSRFSAMGVVGMTVLQNLTTAAMNAGAAFTSSIIDPIASGGWTRAENIEQAKFMIEGLGKDWQALSKDINTAVDGTAYGFDEAAMAAGQLSASGISAGQDMEKALGGIAGTAAMTGRSYSDISAIFTTVAGNGRLMAEQLLQFSYSGVNAAATLAKYLGTDEATVRDMVSKGEISFQTFSDAMYSAFGTHAKDANKTFTGSMSNVHAAMSRIGADFASVLISSEDQANGINNLIGILGSFRNVLNGVRAMLKSDTTVVNDFTDNFHTLADIVVKFLDSMYTTTDGATKLVEPLSHAFSDTYTGIKNLVNFVLSIAGAMKSAWDSVFPPITFVTIEKIAAGFLNLTSKFKLNNANLSNLKDTFAGFFSVLDLVGRGLTIVWNMFDKNILPIVGDAITIFLSVTGAIGRFIKSIDDGVPSLSNFSGKFDSVKTVLSNIRAALKKASDSVSDFFNSLDPDSTPVTEAFTAFINKVSDLLQKLETAGKKVVSVLKTVFGDIGSTLSGLLKNFNLDDLLNEFNIVMTGGFVTSIATVARNLSQIVSQVKSLSSVIKGPLIELKQTLVAWQNELNAKTLITIAAAVAILAGAIVVMSLVNVDSLNNAVGAVGTLFGVLIASTKLFNQLGAKGFEGVAASLVILSIAILILTSAVAKIAKLDWAGFTRGISAVVILMYALEKFAASINSGKVKSFIGVAASLLIFSVAIRILANSVAKLGSIDTNSLVQGLLGVMVLLVGISYFLTNSKMDGMSIGVGLGLLAMAAAMKILADIVDQLGSMDTNTLVQGLVGVGAVLLELAAFLKLINKVSGGALVGAASLLIASAALKVIAGVMTTIGGMSSQALGTALLGIGGALVILCLALTGFKGSISGSAALLIAAAALVVLAGPLQTFANMSTDQIAHSLIVLGAALVELVIGLNGMNGAVSGAVALIIAAVALNILAIPLQTFANMSLDQIASALITMAGALAILIVAVNAASTGIVGAGALLVVAVALAVLAIPIAVLGNLSLAQVAGGLIALAAGLAVLIIAGAAASVVAIGLLAMGGAILLFGVGALLASVGISILAGALPGFVDGLNTLSQVDAVGLGAVALAVAAFGVAALVASPGMLLFGIGSALAGVGIALLGASVGTMSAIAVGLNGIANVNAGGLIAIGAALLILGVGEIVAGAGGLVIGAGALVASAGLIALSIGIFAVEAVLGILPASFSNAGTSAGDFANQLNAAVQPSTDAAANLKSGVEGGVSGLGDDLSNTGSDAGSSLANGLLGTSDSNSDAGQSLTNAIGGGLDGLSTDMSTDGTDGGQSLTDAINSMQDQASSAGSNLGSSASSGADSGLGDWNSKGADAGQGFINGLGSMVSSAASAAASFGQNALDWLSKALDSHSPSRETGKRGVYFGQGFIIGMNKTGDDANAAAYDLGKSSLNSLSKALSGVADVVSNSTDSALTITPVLDLSEVEKGATKLNGLLSAQNVTSSATLSYGIAQTSAVAAIVASRASWQNQNGSVSTVDDHSITLNLDSLDFNDDDGVKTIVRDFVCSLHDKAMMGVQK